MLLIPRSMYKFTILEMLITEYNENVGDEMFVGSMYSLIAEKANVEIPHNTDRMILAFIKGKVSDKIDIPYGEDLYVLTNGKIGNIDEVIFDYFGSDIMNSNDEYYVLVGFVQKYYFGDTEEDGDLYIITKYNEYVYEGVGMMFEVKKIF